MRGQLKFAAAAAAGALSVAGCGVAVHQSASTPTLPAPAPVSSAHVPTIGILVGTNPVNRTLHRVWAAEASQVATAAGRSKARVIIDRFGIGPGSSDVMFNASLTSTDGLNHLIVQAQVMRAEHEMVRAFDDEQATVIPGPTDLISGIQEMEDHLHELHAVKADVIVFGNAEQMTGPVNLANPVQLADPSGALEKVKAQGLLQASACRGWNVYMVDPMPAGFSGLQDAQLREFWREFFTACGGHLVLWDSTLIFPASGQIPPATWATPGHREIVVPLPASMLFQPDQAILLPGAGRILGELCHDLTSTYRTATAKIAGYTAAVGGDGIALSRARAEDVASYLKACGVRASQLSAHGYGNHDQIPGGWAANRRVVVTLQVHRPPLR